jgi:hypothetical protein
VQELGLLEEKLLGVAAPMKAAAAVLVAAACQDYPIEPLRKLLQASLEHMKSSWHKCDAMSHPGRAQGMEQAQ